MHRAFVVRVVGIFESLSSSPLIAFIAVITIINNNSYHHCRRRRRRRHLLVTLFAASLRIKGLSQLSGRYSAAAAAAADAAAADAAES